MNQVPLIDTDLYEVRRVEHTRLRRRKTDALVLEHNVCHFLDQLADAVIDFLDRLCRPSQHLRRKRSGKHNRR